MSPSPLFSKTTQRIYLATVHVMNHDGAHQKKIQIVTLIIQSYSLVLRNERDVLLKYLLFPLESFLCVCVCIWRKEKKRSALDSFQPLTTSSNERSSSPLRPRLLPCSAPFDRPGSSIQLSVSFFCTSSHEISLASFNLRGSLTAPQRPSRFRSLRVSWVMKWRMIEPVSMTTQSGVDRPSMSGGDVFGSIFFN